ncbi:MAG: Crp/Fnr family transcriptional regulator [Dongiaceae bacterium]
MSMTPHRVSGQPAAGEPSASTGDPERFQRRTGITAADYAVLANVPLFSGLPEPALRTLLADAWVQNFSRNTVLFLQGEPATRCYVVMDGWVKLFRSMIDGHETVIAVFTRGESFAEAAIFDRANFPVGGAVVEDSRLLVIPAEPFMRRLSENGEYALKVLASMSRHLRRLVSQVERLTQRSSAERVAEFLLRLSPVIAGPVVIQLPLDKALIAGRLGMQPETFSRSLAKLRGIGVLCKGPEIRVPDVIQLRRFADGSDG